MQRWRSSTAVALAAASCVLLSACGSGSGSSASDSDTYTIGVINSNTGALGVVGQQEAEGINLAISEINAAGGVNGHQLKIKAIDDQGSVNLTTQAFKELATTDKVQMIIGPGISANAKAAAPLADTYNVNEILLVAQADMANGTKNVFETPPPGVANTEAILKYAADHGVKTASIIWANTPYGQEGLADVEASASKYGITMETKDSYDPAKFDFTAQASEVAQANPDAVFLYGTGGTSDGQLLKAVRDSGYKGKILGGIEWCSQSTVPKVAGPAADTIAMLSPVNYADPVGDEKKFIDDYTKKYGASPSILAAYAYVAVQLGAAAIKEAGSYDASAISQAMETMPFESFIGKSRFTEDYHGGPGATAFGPLGYKGSQYGPPPF